MLMAIRDRFTGMLAWVVVILISIPFVFWGIQEYLGLGRTNYALMVNGDEISNNDYMTSYQANRQALQQSFGGKVPTYFNEAEYLQKQTMDRLINNRLLLQAAEDINLRVGSTALAENIMSMPAFQLDGKFDQSVYESQLQAIRRSKSKFEQDLQEDMIMGQIRKGIASTAFATERQMADYAKIQYQSRDIEYVLLKSAEYEKNIEISDEAVSKYYDEHLQNFVSEEKVSIEFIELNITDLKDQVEVKEELLLQKYDEAVSSGGYSSEETRDASHILIRVPQDSSDEVVAEKKKQIEEVHERLKKGESFSELAKLLSEDPGSAQQGGSLSTVERGVMVKPFEDALFGLSEDKKLSDPVKTTFGFHIIQLDKINSEEKIPFEEVRDTLEEDYRQEEAEKLYYDLSETIANLVFQNESSLEPASKATGLAIKSSNKFTKVSGQGIAQTPGVRTAAFSEDVLINKYNSELVEVAENHIVSLRLKEHEPSVQRTLQEVKNEIVSTLRQQSIDERIASAADSLIEAAQGSALNDELVKEYKTEIQKVDGLKRDDRETLYEIVNQVFKMEKPKDGDLPAKKIRLSDGTGYAVVVLKAIHDGDIAWVENEQKSRANKQLESANSSSEFEAILASLKTGADILINSELQSNNNNIR